MKTYAKVLTGMLCVGVLAAPLPAMAQVRGVVGGLGGVTFGSEKGGNVATDAGVDLGKYVRISGEFGRLTSILPTAISDDVALQANNYAATFGNTATTSGKLAATTFTGLLRVQGDRSNRVNPFAEAGVGMARLSGSMVAVMNDPINGNADISSQITEPLLTGTTTTQGLFTAGGGLTFALSRQVGLDVGYRYGRIMGTNPINTGRVYTGVQVHF
jgi:opacity protein-like surface antigen